LFTEAVTGCADTLEADLAIAAAGIGIGEVGEEADHALAFSEEPLAKRRGHGASVTATAALRRGVNARDGADGRCSRTFPAIETGTSSTVQNK